MSKVPYYQHSWAGLRAATRDMYKVLARVPVIGWALMYVMLPCSPFYDTCYSLRNISSH